MSMPIISAPENPVTREQAVNDLIESVAMMEAGMSHVINAEGEKIQKVVDPDADYPLEDIINVNNSAEKMINTMSKLEMMLQSKLEATKEFDTGTTPGPGPTPTPGGTEFGLSAGNLEETVLSFTTEGEQKLIPLHTINYSNGFTASATSESFTVANSGNYLITYMGYFRFASLNSGFNLSVSVNNIPNPNSNIFIISTNDPHPFTNSIILPLEAGDTVSLALVNATLPIDATLYPSLGASLTLTKIA